MLLGGPLVAFALAVLPAVQAGKRFFDNQEKFNRNLPALSPAMDKAVRDFRPPLDRRTGIFEDWRPPGPVRLSATVDWAALTVLADRFSLAVCESFIRGGGVHGINI